jgi:hypothetical protein
MSKKKGLDEDLAEELMHDLEEEDLAEELMHDLENVIDHEKPKKPAAKKASTKSKSKAPASKIESDYLNHPKFIKYNKGK